MLRGVKAFEIAASLLASLAWPIVVVVLVIVFRKPIKDLASHDPRRRPLRRAKLGPVEVEWDSLEEARTEAAAEKADEPAPTPDISSGKLGDLLALAEQHPTAAVILAAKKVEHALARALRSNNIEPARSYAMIELVRTARMNGLISDGTEKVLNSLRTLRNQVLHLEDASVTPARAVDYVTTVEEILDELAEITKPVDGDVR